MYKRKKRLIKRLNIHIASIYVSLNSRENVKSIIILESKKYSRIKILFVCETTLKTEYQYISQYGIDRMHSRGCLDSSNKFDFSVCIK